jgi:hypothetical protein
MVHVASPDESHVLAVKQPALVGAELHHEETGLGIANVGKQDKSRKRSAAELLYSREAVLRCNTDPVVDDPRLLSCSCYLGTALDDSAFMLREERGHTDVYELRSHSMVQQDLPYFAH